MSPEPRVAFPLRPLLALILLGGVAGLGACGPPAGVPAARVATAVVIPTDLPTEPTPEDGRAADRGDFTLAYEPADDPYLDELRADVRAAGDFDDMVAALNDTFALPRDVAVRFAECGEDNAFYDEEDGSILVCYELVAQLEDAFVANGDGDEAFGKAVDAAVFIFHHEVGHALVHVLALPVTGKEEDAVDDLAAIVVMETWEDGDAYVLNGAQSFFLTGVEEADAGEHAYWDEHSLDLQRYYSIACLVYGRDPEAHADLVGGDELPAERAELCPEEYARKLSSWLALLDPYLREDAGG